jgi:hypothetical protein
MRLGLGACALMLFCAIAVRHASAQDGSICALLDDDRKRLDCYDLLFKKPLVGGATTSPSEESNNAGPGKSDWLVEQETSKFDDSQNVRVYVLAKDSFVDFLHKRRTPVLTVACHEGEVYAYVVFDTVMQSEPLVYRLDKKSPRKARRSAIDESRRSRPLDHRRSGGIRHGADRCRSSAHQGDTLWSQCGRARVSDRRLGTGHQALAQGLQVVT